MNMYGKIPETIISKKLGIGICNPAPDWVEGLQDDFEEELLIHEHEISSFKKSGYAWTICAWTVATRLASSSCPCLEFGK